MKRAVIILLTAAMVFAAVSLCGCSRVRHYDYTGELDNIASVEILDITYTSSCEEELEYEVKRVFEQDEWAHVIGDAAKLDYRTMLGDPPFWQEGLALKIEFVEPVDGNAYVLLTRLSPVFAEMKNGEIDLQSYAPSCRSEQWDAFIAKYTDIDPE